MPPIRQLVLTLAVAAAVVFPAAASADSVVYMKNGNVWIANPDGSGARQFTLHAYNWHSPSEADDGTIAVAGGLQRTNADGSDSSGSSEIYRFQADGNQIGTYTPTYGSYSTPSCPAYAPTRVRIAPDGSKIAYGIYGCGAGGYMTSLWTPADSTTLNFPDQTVGQEDFVNPIWIDSSRFAMSHNGPPPVSTGAQWGEHLVTDGDNVGGGWYDADETDRAPDAAISRDGTTAVVFFQDAFAYTDNQPRHVTMRVYHNASVPSGWTTNGYGDYQCSLDLPAASYTDVADIDPSLSPDGSKVMWGDSAGVELMALGDVSSGCAGHSGVVTLIPGGSQPFYAKGNLQPGAANPTQPGGTTAGGTGTAPAGTTPTLGSQGGAAIGRLFARFTVATKKARMKVGRKITFDAHKSSEANGRITRYRWKFGDGKKGSGKRVSHRYRKRRKYTVVLTVTDAAGHHATARHKVKIHR